MTTTTDIDKFTVSYLAREVGINLETVRFYERKGLLPKPRRSASGYRLYTTDAVRRLKFIKRAQELGFSLREILQLLALRMSPKANNAEIRRRTESKIAEIEKKIKTLESMKQVLRKLVESCSECAPHSPCPILESLEGENS